MTYSLSRPAAYVITKGEATPETFDPASSQILDIVRLAVEREIPLVQLREKQLPARLLFELARSVATITSGSRTRLLINDRADVAVAAGADGVQLTSRSIPAKVIRKAFSKDLIIGVSCHSSNEVERAADEGADFALFGPVFATPGKDQPTGLELLETVCDTAGAFPVIAVGGVDDKNYRCVIDAGAAGFAAIRFLNEPDNLRDIGNGKA